MISIKNEMDTHYKKGDFIITTIPQFDFYSNQPYYFYLDKECNEYSNMYSDRGRRELWSNKPLISDTSNLGNLIRSAQSDCWIILQNTPELSAPTVKNFLEQHYHGQLYNLSRQTNILLYRLNLM
jgi:hypothetical protein